MKHQSHITRRLHAQHGGTAIWFALCLPLLLALAALAVDLTRLNLLKAELQSAADAAALGGAYSISVPSKETVDQPYNWTAARATATQVAASNVANGNKITDATVETGYWNIKDPSKGFRKLTTPVTGDVPAVRVTIAISSNSNSGPVNFFLAPILGIATTDIAASAIAVTGPPMGGTGIFPFVIDKAIYDANWHTGDQQSFTIKNNYPIGKGDGNWSSLNNPDNSRSTISGIMTTGNTKALSLNSGTIWISTGTMDALYQQADSASYIGKVFAVPVVVILSANSLQPYTITAFQITSVDSKGNPKSITGKFIDGYTFPGLTLGDGSGKLNGAFPAPVLVK